MFYSFLQYILLFNQPMILK